MLNIIMSDKIILSYRALVFILALSYWLYQFDGIFTDPFGWQFRYLTIWSLTTSLFVAGQLLSFSCGFSDKSWNTLTSVATVISMVVVIQYWRLYFIDPLLVGSGEIPWHQQYYLHLVGPALLWIDAFFILGAFQKLKKILFFISVFSVSYPIWMEIILRPINSIPIGTITNGLPYPFLNDMLIINRIIFYTVSIMLNFLLIFVGWFLSNILFRKIRQKLISS
tara:strand:- start:31 stop:699 length:669 start_codon:yes stop_codon:yes gene_type:complete